MPASEIEAVEHSVLNKHAYQYLYAGACGSYVRAACAEHGALVDAMAEYAAVPELTTYIARKALVPDATMFSRLQYAVKANTKA